MVVMVVLPVASWMTPSELSKILAPLTSPCALKFMFEFSSSFGDNNGGVDSNDYGVTVYLEARV